MFTVDAKRRKGVKNITKPQPRKGTTSKTRTVFMSMPTTIANIKKNLLLLPFKKPITTPSKAIPKAIGICNRPKGKPDITDVAICPTPNTKAPIIGPKYKAEKNPGKESKATVGKGLGSFMKEPTTVKAENMAVIAIWRISLKSTLSPFLS